MILEGNVSVKAAILGARRKVTTVIVDQTKHDKDTSFILHRAAERGIEIVRTDREEIDNLTIGKTHGGLIAMAEGRQYQTMDDLLKKENPFFALVEGVEDPFNLGYVIRSLYSAGCDGLLLDQRDWQRVESVILKSSAGAFEYLDIVMCENPAADIVRMKNAGIKTYAAMRKDAISYFDADLTRPLFIAVGGEMRGLSSKVRAEIEQNIYIPYANDFRNALNASGACSALAFEVMRQNLNKQ
ncbi:MAG: RNA methyltransferase [Solobacterium sp.]|nr:RNA methyltransferase [Solobacterium sp.]